MAPPMRSSSLQETGHRARVAESSGGHATAKPTDTISSTIPPAAHQPANFEYDDNEWDVGIGDLIIDLDADIEKTNEVTSMAANAAPGAAQGSKTPSAGKMHIEHSATADKGLKMKIKRTKPGSKTSEAKHEIVKSNEQNGSSSDQADVRESSISLINKHNPIPNAAAIGSTSSSNASGNNKRGSSGHRRDKVRDKHGSSSSSSSSSTSSNSSSGSSSGSSFSSSNEKSNAVSQKSVAQSAANPPSAAEVNGIIRLSSSQPGPPRTVFPVSTGPGPPQNSPRTTSEPSPGAPASPPPKSDQLKDMSPGNMAMEDQSPSPPPVKKVKTEIKEVTDVCIGTSVGTITEPDCLGPCEPGTSVTLEGIVWHETEGGVLVVNVTWRGKTYVGTLLDCTRHDWAPPRFCDSPTSDLDSRTPKGRETRSSVHSKLRNGGNIAIKGRRGGTNNGSGQSTTPSSPTPFVLPRPDSSTKRKSRSEEEPAQLNNTPGKKSKVVIPPPVANPLPTTPTPCGSPPPSPVLLECPEPNCSKKYKHINGLKYHQSHAHGSADDDDTKDVTSTSENDESNIEAPSPATPVKSPDKSQDGPATPLKKESSELPMLLRGSTANLLEMPSQSVTPRSTPPSPATPQSNQESPSAVRSPNVVAAAATTSDKNIIKPGILRYTGNEEYSIGVFSGSNIQGLQTAGSLSSGQTPSNAILDGGDQPRKEPDVPCQTPLFTPQFPTQSSQPTNAQIQQQQQQQPPPPLSPQRPQSPNASAKVSQFKVKPASALMPDDKKTNSNNKSQLINKKKNRKSPAGGPDSPQIEELPFDAENTGRDEVLSPAYSDISDDGAPVVDADMNDKSKNLDKKTESGHALPPMPQYGMFHPFYGQTHHQYLVSQENNSKEQDVQDEKSAEKEKKDNPEYPQKVLQHYYPYGYVPSYPYNMDTNYGGMSLVQDDKMKDDRKESSSPIEPPPKPPVSMPNPIQIPMPTKMKADHNPKDKQNENHQILKESIEMKNQMNSFIYSRPQNQQPQQQPPQQQPAQQQPQQPPPSHHGQREEDIRRFYVYSEQKRKEPQSIQEKSTMSSGKSNLPQSPNIKVKEIKMEDKKEKEVKQEGVKPTMETQGPPPPPTSQYAYIHPSYMQQAHYGALPFDPNHPMYRGLMVPGPYGSSPYLHAPIQRYHAPEDLSRAPPPSKALDMLQHHAQYYSSHKIHELQERAIKSPTPKTSVASSSPSTNQPGGPPSSQAPSQPSAPGGQPGGNVQQGGGKQPPNDSKESRSPPPQRHVHTHHHTHVGLGYPMYPAPYGAAVLASQQAAAVTVINPYPTK